MNAILIGEIAPLYFIPTDLVDSGLLSYTPLYISTNHNGRLDNKSRPLVGRDSPANGDFGFKTNTCSSTFVTFFVIG